MDVRTYRAKSMQEALAVVRQELGPEAAVLHTREVRSWLGWIGRQRQIEVTASAGVHVPSRLVHNQVVQPQPQRQPTVHAAEQPWEETDDCEALDTLEIETGEGESGPREDVADFVPPAHEDDYGAKFREDLKGQLEHLHSMIEELSQKQAAASSPELPESLFRLFADLIDGELSEELSRELVERVRTNCSPEDLCDPAITRSRLARLVEDEITTQGPIEVTPGQCRLVALVGPTGVGKTTTIAKLAANYHLRQQCRVGLITVDTYRIAAVEQLRTYADIIDLPMEVVSTPKQMREAIQRLADLDLILLDTAGRSPRDELQLQELKSILGEARADEVHLVLSSVSSEASLKNTAQRFSKVGTTALIFTKLDEATGLGNLLPLLRSCQLPLSYVTNGQSVPDDIEAASPRKLARRMLGVDGP